MAQRSTFSSSTSYPVQRSDIAVALTAAMDGMLTNVSNFKDSPLLAAINKGSINRDVMRWVMEAYENNSFTSANVSDGISGLTDDKDSRFNAEVVVGDHKVYGALEFSSMELAVAGGSSIAELQNLVELQLSQKTRNLLQFFNDSLYNAVPSATSSLIGLETLFTTNSYANVTHTLASYVGTTPNVDYYPLWRPLSADASVGGATMTYNDGHGDAGTLVNPTVNQTSGSEIHNFMDDLMLTMDLQGRMYNAIVMGPKVYYRYQQEYKEKVTINVQNGQVINPEFGVTGLSYQGIPIIRDHFCPDDTIYFLDQSMITLYTVPLPGTGLGENKTEAGFGIPNVYIAPIAQDTSHVLKFEISLIPLFVYRNTRGINRIKIVA